jgi:hypothetical protein
MLNTWIESVFLKRILLAIVAATVAHLVAFVASPVALHALAYLANIGLIVTVQIQPDKLTPFLTVSLFALTQGAHEWVAAKWPELGKYI